MCEPTLGGPTGTFTYNGGSFTAVDSMVFVTLRENVATEWVTHPFRTELRIRITDYANACDLEKSGAKKRGFNYFQVTLMEASETAHPGLPPVGTYTYIHQYEFGFNEPTFTGAGESDDCNNDCQECGNLLMVTPVGSVTLTSVSETQVAGTFDYELPNASHFTGSFDVPVCTNTEEDYCCWDGQ